MCALLLLDMSRPNFRLDQSAAYKFRQQNLRKNDNRGFVSYPPRYYSRPPRPTGYGTSAVGFGTAQSPSASKPVPASQTSHPDISSSFVKSSAQQKTSDNAVKKNDCSVSTTMVSTAADLQQLKWQAGQGPAVELRLLVPGRVRLLIWVSILFSFTGFPRFLESPGFFLENFKTWKVLEKISLKITHFSIGSNQMVIIYFCSLRSQMTCNPLFLNFLC